MKAFLDPNDEWGGNWQELPSKITAAEISSKWTQTMSQLDDRLSKSAAESITKLGYDQATAWQKFETMKLNESLYTEKLGEVDLRMEEHGLEAEFGIDTSSQYTKDEIIALLNKREEERKAVFAGGGGAIVTQEGTGLGSAR